MKQLLTVMNRLNKQTHQTLISCKYCNMFNIMNDFQLLQKKTEYSPPNGIPFNHVWNSRIWC